MIKTWFLFVQQLVHSLFLWVHSQQASSHRDIHFSKGQPNHQEFQAASLRPRRSFLEPSHWKHHGPLHKRSNPLVRFRPPSHLLHPLFLHRPWKRRHEIKQEWVKAIPTLKQGSHLRLRIDQASDHKVFQNCYS